MIRYIKYYASQEQIYDSPVISAFDLLYDEYDKSLEKLNARLNPNDSAFKSEQIVTQLLREILIKEAFYSVKFHKQVNLIQLVSTKNNTFTEREWMFMRNKASCDFVLYFKVGKAPIGVIEVDGNEHTKAERIIRDQLKNAILAKAGIPLLRLKTIESRIEEKIETFLSASLNHSEKLVS